MTYLNLEFNKSSFYLCVSLTCSLLWIGCEGKQSVTTIYDSKEFKSINNEVIKSGKSVWSKACFRCHTYGTNGAASLQNKQYWDNASSKGIESLFQSVWNGIQVEHGMMPPKGFCNTCTEKEIKNSILYLFYLSQKISKEGKVIASEEDR
tara:strand:+ start:872 stop:1321 length:450 start_codon:yes stop_codon:yes gene_type:complete